MSVAVGDRLGSYEIVGVIGAGGMGSVYRARDTRLGRTVALKLVKDMAVDAHAGARLVREAQHASALNHPNICTIHEIGEANGHVFIVMEYVEGRPLSELIPQNGMPVDRAVRLAVQIADAVAHAHEHGILHRDLKPLNVVVTREGRIKVLDFGLARRIWHEGADHLPTMRRTSFDVVAGTVAYMPPEALQGKAGDSRSDIWALGAMLYQLVAGRLPFAGDTDYEVSARILREPPTPLPAHVPVGVSTTIEHCLMKDPDQRYQHAAEVRAALEASTTSITASAVHRRSRSYRRVVGVGLAAILTAVAFVVFFSGRALAVSSIAVVPFVNAENDPETEYLSDGLTESVINSLAQWPQPRLKVIALNSVMRYKRREVDPQTVGHDLSVEAVVVGRIISRQDRLSVTAELVNVRDKSRMWGATYNTTMADVFAVQDEIASKISDNLRLRLDRDARKRLTKRYAENVEAYQLYLKGRYVLNKYTEEGWTKAIDFFRQALEIDPTYALAWSGLADSYYQLSSLVLLPGEAIPKARAAAMKALEIDDTLAEAHASLGIIKSQYDWDRAGAEKEFRRALELNPSYALAHTWLGQYCYYVNGQFERSLIELRRAQELDPLSFLMAIYAVYPLPALGRQAEAVQQLQNAVAMFPDVPALTSYFHDVRGNSYLVKGMVDEAVADLLRGYEMSFVTGGSADSIAALTDAYRSGGIDGYWRKELELAIIAYRSSVDLASKQPHARYVTPYKLASLYARVKDTDHAFALLEEAYKNRDENLLWIKAESLTPGSPWQGIAADPRLHDLIARLGLGGS